MPPEVAGAKSVCVGRANNVRGRLIKTVNPVIGVDFDNTIVSHDYIVSKLAYEKNYVNESETVPKKHIRDSVRRLPNGETKWQELQAEIYGRRMEEAVLMDGVREFFGLCRKNRFKVYVVSHKTEFSNLGKSPVNLRIAALNWMKENGLGLSLDNVYFESTRQEKIERVKKLKCTHFIDDLDETFAEFSFPSGVEKILYDPQAHRSYLPDIRIARTWKEISDYIFGTRN